MRRLCKFTIAMWLAAAVGNVDTPCFAQAQATPASALLKQLDSSDFDVRSQAQRQLQKSPVDPSLIVEQILRADGESQTRLIGLLEHRFLSDSGAGGEEAERELWRLGHSQLPCSRLAACVLQSNLRLRESRARHAIERLGGVFAYETPDGRVPESQALAPGLGVGFGPHALLHSILLPHDWQGTAADLWHLTRLEHCENVVIYDSVFNSVSHEEVQAVTKFAGGIRIEQRGGYLGLTTTNMASDPSGGVRATPVPGGAAHAAKLQASDLIRAVNEVPVSSFTQLVQRLQPFHPGDVVRISIERDGQPMVLPVTLGSWRGQLTNPEFGVPAPPLYSGPLGNQGPPSPSLPEALPEEMPRFLIRLF